MHVFQPYTVEAQFISIRSYSHLAIFTHCRLTSPKVAQCRLTRHWPTKRAKESYSQLDKCEHSEAQSHPQCHGRWTAFIVMRTH